MNNSIDNETKAELRRLGYRKDPADIAECVTRLDQGDTPWQLYNGKEAIVSQELGRKIGRDFADGKLDFLKNFHVDGIERSRSDSFRATRYGIVKEAEKLAPHKWWNMQHMRAIGISEDDARKLLTEYDEIRVHREKAEITLDSLDENGEKTRPTKKVMAKFRTLPAYLKLLYQMYYMTTYPDATALWVIRASDLRVDGVLDSDQHLVDAADDVMRYEVWQVTQKDHTGVVMKNLDTYFSSLSRLKKTKGSHKKFIKDLCKRFGVGGMNNG